MDRDIRPPRYMRTRDAMEAVDVLVMIEQLGDEVLALARNERLQGERAEKLLFDLMACVAEPIQNSRRVVEIEKKVRALGE